MTRGTIRALLRRRLMDTAAVEWSDGDLNDIINVACGEVQKGIAAADATAFLTISRQNLETGKDLYPKPEGAWSVLDVELKQVDGTYKTMGDPVTTLELTRSVGADQTATRWAHYGRWIKISPIPTANTTNGLQWTYVQSITLSEDDDTPPFHTGLHNAVVLAAELILAPELAELDVKEVRQQFQEQMAGIPLYYRRSVGREVALAPDLDKGY